MSATFSEDMDRSTLTTTTFTLTKQGSTSPLAATVSYDSASKKATLDPTSDLEANTSYTARVTGGSSGAKDLAGNALEQDYSWTFGTAADTTAPETTIDSGPSGTVSSTTASFGFSSNESNVTFECRLDGAVESCTLPKNYTGLSEGTHTFEVRAVDSAGNVDPTPASRTWTVDIAPETIIVSGPSEGSYIKSISASFSFSSPQAYPSKPLRPSPTDLTVSLEPLKTTSRWSHPARGSGRPECAYHDG